MLNGWDVLAVIVISIVIYAIIHEIIMGSCTKKAIDKAEKLGCTKDELFDYVDKRVNDSEAAMNVVLNKEIKEGTTKKSKSSKLKTDNKINKK